MKLRFLVHRRAAIVGVAAAAALVLAHPVPAKAGCILLIICTPATKTTSPPPATKYTALPRFFAPDSVWNVALPQNAPLAANSAQLVASLQSTLTSYLPWVNTTSYSVPVYTVSAGQKLVKVTLRNNKWSAPQAAIQSQFNYVPIPSGAKASQDSDASMVIYQPSSDTMWEMWSVQYNWLFGWSFAWGARISHVSTDPGIVPAPYGSSASGLPAVGGLMSIAEMQAGTINHAVSFVVPHPAAGTFVWPAQRTDGDGPSTGIPEGTRFRLPANLSIAALHLSPVATMIATAVQKYGMILHDKGGAVAFFAEDPSQYPTNPYPAIFGGQMPDKALAGFPWDKLQAVVPEPVSKMVTTDAAPVTAQPELTNAAPQSQPTQQSETPQPVSGPMRRLDF